MVRQTGPAADSGSLRPRITSVPLRRFRFRSGSRKGKRKCKQISRDARNWLGARALPLGPRRANAGSAAICGDPSDPRASGFPFACFAANSARQGHGEGMPDRRPPPPWRYGARRLAPLAPHPSVGPPAARHPRSRRPACPAVARSEAFPRLAVQRAARGCAQAQMLPLREAASRPNAARRERSRLRNIL
jgi:hypothetical protein